MKEYIMAFLEWTEFTWNNFLHGDTDFWKRALALAVCVLLWMIIIDLPLWILGIGPGQNRR